MARRKDHTPEQLKVLIRSAAEKLIYAKGLHGLTARALAREVGYTPGTIYNIYRDMDALVIDINYETLGRLYQFCQDHIQNLPHDYSKVRALAYAYVDFAHENQRAWETIFSISHKGTASAKLPKQYRQRLVEIFELIEYVLQECLTISEKEAAKTARLLWACLHGITVLTLDGRLNLMGIDAPHHMIDDFLQKQLSHHVNA